MHGVVVGRGFRGKPPERYYHSVLPPLDETLSVPTDTSAAPPRCIAARILAHPDRTRIGEFTPLFDDDDGRRQRPVLLGRLTPDFRTMSGQLSGPLGSPRITRTPIRIERVGGGLGLQVSGEGPAVEVNGQALVGERTIAADELVSGVVVLSGRDLALWIGWLELVESAPPVEGLVGESTLMRKLRQQIHRVADLDVPVLLRGATGVGKELVAAAIHRYSRRAAESYIAVNVAGVPTSMAASELFGHKRGAFTGAFEERKGYFAQADGGTLFLDEIGDVSFDVQALLLRAVQEGVIQPLGGSTRKVDVRLIAATDSDLESAVARREFREPLLRRFSYEIHVPPLRARRDDIGVLFEHLLRARLAAMGQGNRGPVAAPMAELQVPAKFMAQLAMYHWPGNVRELANVALKFAIENRGLERAKITDDLMSLITSRPDPAQQSAPPAQATERRDEPTDGEILEALQAEEFRRERAAKRLGVSKSYLYRRLDQAALVPTAADIPSAELRATIEACAGNLKSAAGRLRISTRALRLQLKRIEPPSR